METGVKGSVQQGLESIAAMVRESGLFGGVSVHPGHLRAEAASSEEPAEYRLFIEQEHPWVGLVTAARYLSQSIEQTLVISGDKAGDLLRDELIDVGQMQSVQEPLPVVEHFRSSDKLYTFRTPLPFPAEHLATSQGQESAFNWLLAYRATFDELGGMAG